MKERDLIEEWLAWKKSHEGPGFSQKQLSIDAGISQTYLSNIMTGARNPGTKTIEKIAGALNLSMAEFYAGPPNGATPHRDSILRTDVGRTNVPSPPPRNKTSVKVIHTDDEESAPTDQEPVESVSVEILPEMASDFGGEPEKTGLALSDTTPDQLEKLFDSVGIPLADLFSMPAALKLPNKIDHSKASPEDKRQQEQDRQNEQMINDQIPLLTRPPSGDFDRWLSSDNWNVHLPRISSCSVEGNHVFAIRLSDDTMTPDMQPGDILIINPDDKFMAIDGGIGVVVHSGRFVVRKIYIHKGDYLLIPSNSAYKMDTAPIEEARIYKIALWIPAVRGKF